MKFSTTFTLATLALLSVGTTHARIVCDTGAEHSKIYDQLQARYNNNCVRTDNSSQGDIDMEWKCIKTYGNGIMDAVTYRAYDPTGKEFVPFSWETEGGDPNSMLSTAKTYNLFKDPCNAYAEYNGDIEPPAPAPPAPAKLEKCDHNLGGQCFHLGKDFKCQKTRLGGNKLDYRCVNTNPAPAPARQLGSRGEKCDHNYGGQCFHLGKDFECQNTQSALGAKPDYRCVNTKPTPAPAPPAPARACRMDHNPTYTPECPSGYSCKAILGGSKKNAGQCTKDSQHRQLGSRGEKCDHKYGGQCFHLGKDFKCQNTRLGGNKSDYRCVNTNPAPAPAPTKPVTCDPKNPVNPNFDCTQKVGPGSKCQSLISGDKWVYQCTKLASHHQRSLETANTTDSLGSDLDENGCKPSAGYSWCASLKECIKEDCPTAKPTHHHHSSSAAALSSTKTIQQYHIAVVATLAASSIVVALVL